MASQRLILCLSVLVMLQASSAEKCCLGVLASTTYRAVAGHALLGHTFMDVPGTSAVKCLALCLSQHGRCHSINYDHVNMFCQMNDATKEEFRSEFQPSLNYSFFGNNKQCPQTQGLGAKTQALQLTTEAADTGGCDSANGGPMGMASRLIPDKTYASSLADEVTVDNIRLYGGGWCARHKDPTPWVTVDFDVMVYVPGVQYTGGLSWDSTLDEFTVSYGDDGSNWMRVQNGAKTEDVVFGAPPNATAVVTSRFPVAVHARFIRLEPPRWSAENASRDNNPFCIQFDLFGCTMGQATGP